MRNYPNTLKRKLLDTISGKHEAVQRIVST